MPDFKMDELFVYDENFKNIEGRLNVVKHYIMDHGEEDGFIAIKGELGDVLRRQFGLKTKGDQLRERTIKIWEDYLALLTPEPLTDEELRRNGIDIPAGKPWLKEKAEPNPELLQKMATQDIWVIQNEVKPKKSRSCSIL